MMAQATTPDTVSSAFTHRCIRNNIAGLRPALMYSALSGLLR